jgi:hypothetical protein
LKTYDIKKGGMLIKSPFSLKRSPIPEIVERKATELTISSYE